MPTSRPPAPPKEPAWKDRRLKIRGESVGWHLFERTAGLHVLLDELDCPPHLRSRVPRFASIALTNTCDLDCPYCYAPKFRARLTQDEVVGWCRELDRAGSLGVGFGGGEPTLWPGLVSLCREVTETTALAVSLTTHGHRLTPDLAKQLRGALHFVRVSVDGIDERYERLRGRSFEQLRERLAHAATIAPLGINTVVNADTIEDLDQIRALAIEVGAQELALLPERAVGGAPGASPGVIRRLQRWLRGALAEENRLRLSVAEGFPTAGLPAFELTDGLDYAHIDASGHLKPTSFEPGGVDLRGTNIMEALEQLCERKAA